jgi:hypothetical protein
MSIRIIYECCSNKNKKQYEQINKLIPKHELYIYDEPLKAELNYVKYNVYLDCINENIYLNSKCDKTILVVNEEYITYLEYLKRDEYKDEPLLLIKNIVDSYICLTKYSYNILLKKKISKNKILLINNACYNIYNLNITDKKYILYDIDKYSWYDNLLIVNTWLKYFINRPEILIIRYNIIKELFIKELNKLMSNKIKDNQINYYKNIIIIDSDKLLKQYENNIQCVLIISSYFNLTTLLNENILKNRFILTLENKISKELITYKNYLIKDINENSFKIGFQKYFDENNKNIVKLIEKNKKMFIKKQPKLPIKFSKNML